MTPLTEMQPYCTSSRASRRQFLRMLLTLGGGLLLNGARSALAAPPLLAWWMDLADQERARAAVSGLVPPHAPPGSIMKLAAAAALLEERLISSNDRLTCRGALVLNGVRYRCQHAHGAVDLRQALGRSCNLFFVQAVEGLSAKRLLAYATAFGLEDPVADEAPYRFPAEPTDPVPFYALGLSSQLQPNALQLLRMAAWTATGAVPGIHAGTWRFIHEGMRLAATQGTASHLDPENRYRLAAKTGTVPYGAGYQSWIVGYFPFEAPRYAFCVRSTAGTALDTAVPLARRFLQARRWPL